MCVCSVRLALVRVYRCCCCETLQALVSVCLSVVIVVVVVLVPIAEVEKQSPSLRTLLSLFDVFQKKNNERDGGRQTGNGVWPTTDIFPCVSFVFNRDLGRCSRSLLV